MLKDDPDLEDALDGLANASAYADDIGEEELARRIARCYQDVGEIAVNDSTRDATPREDHR